METAQCSLALGKALGMGKRHADAYEHCVVAFDILKDIYGPEHVLVARAYADSGAQLKHMKRERDAEAAYRYAFFRYGNTLACSA